MKNKITKPWIAIIVFMLLFISWNTICANATSWRTNSEWCHNSLTAWRHCHNSWYTSTTQDTTHKSTRYLSDYKIKEELSRWHSCNEIWWTSEDFSQCLYLKRKHDASEKRKQNSLERVEEKKLEELRLKKQADANERYKQRKAEEKRPKEEDVKQILIWKW